VSVAAETLADAVWHGAPPDSWPKALQMHVLRLREAIGRSQIETTGSGYRLDASPTAVDAGVFDSEVPSLLARTGHLDAEADTRLSALLGLWRGVPFEELGAWPPAVFARERLSELRSAALDARATSRVTRGTASVAELTDLVNEDPLREPRWALLMLALYRAGRQTEALQAFQRARKTLTVEFGLEPGTDLVALERAILDHDPLLDLADVGYGAFGPSATIEFQREARELFDQGEREAAVAALEAGIAAARERGGDARSLCEACIDLADYAQARGDWTRANDAICDAVRLARGVDDAALFARAALVASGEGWITGLDPVGSPVALLEEALARVPSAPSRLRARLHARLAVAASGSRPAAADSEEALRLAAMVDDPTTLAVALHSRLVVDQDIAHLEQRRADGLRLLALADSRGAPQWRAWALPALARVEAMLGEVALADAHFAELERLADVLDDPVARYHATYGDVLRTTMRSDYSAAIQAIERARDAGVRAMPDPSGPALGYFGSLGIIQLLQGVVSESYASFVPMETDWPQPTMDATFRAWAAVVSAERGDLESARAALRRLDRETLAALPHDPYWPSLIWLLSVALGAIEDRERAETVYELALPFAGVLIVDLGATFLGAMSHHLGVLAATFGADRVAADHLAAARGAHERLGADGWAAQSRLQRERIGTRP